MRERTPWPVRLPAVTWLRAPIAPIPARPPLPSEFASWRARRATLRPDPLRLPEEISIARVDARRLLFVLPPRKRLVTACGWLPGQDRPGPAGQWRFAAARAPDSPVHAAERALRAAALR